jgi:hypothetical protein
MMMRGGRREHAHVEELRFLVGLVLDLEPSTHGSSQRTVA